MEPIKQSRKSLFDPRPAANAGFSSSENFAMRVDSYDTSSKPNVVKGERLDTRAPVTVFLREDIGVTYKGRFKRSEIADLAAERKDRNHPGTVVGGTLLVQDGQKQGNGTYGARWITPLSHTPGEAEVFHATIHVSPVQSKGDKLYSRMTVLHDGEFSTLSNEMMEQMLITPPFVVTGGSGQLREALTSLLADGLGVGVRVRDADGFDARLVSRKKDQKPADAVASFFDDIKNQLPLIDSGELTCDVIPYGTLWAGPATLDVMTSSKVVASRLARFNEEAMTRGGKKYFAPVFHRAIVAVRWTKADANGNRAAYFSHFEPLTTQPAIKGLETALCFAQSEDFSPKIPKLESEPESKADGDTRPDTRANTRPDLGADSGFDQFDAGDSLPASDDALMDAAETMDIGDDMPAANAPIAPPAAPERPARRYAGRRG